MSVYVIAQLKFTKEDLYRRYQACFFDVFKQFTGRLLVADEKPATRRQLAARQDRGDGIS